MELRALVDLASDAALAISSGSRIVAWNERATSLLGYVPEQALGRPCYDVLQAMLPSGEPLCTPECSGKSCFAHHMPFAVQECLLRHRDGRWLEASLSTVVAPASADERTEAPTIAVVFLQPRMAPEGTTTADQQLRISALGRFNLTVGSRELPIDRWHRRHALLLLKLLVTHRGTALHREHVIECLWPDASERRGRQRLKVTTHFLRQQMRAAGVHREIVVAENGTFALRQGAVWLDCEMLESFLEEGRRLEKLGRVKDALTCFEKAARLYRGDYLPDERYAEWCAEERERLREIYFDVLGHMVDGHLDCGNHEQAAHFCRLALSREPCRERFHRALMLCLSHLGQSDRAIAHYLRCRDVLRAELGVEPSPETERLYRALVVSGKRDAAVVRTGP